MCVELAFKVLEHVQQGRRSEMESFELRSTCSKVVGKSYVWPSHASSYLCCNGKVVGWGVGGGTDWQALVLVVGGMDRGGGFGSMPSFHGHLATEGLFVGLPPLLLLHPTTYCSRLAGRNLLKSM